MEAFFFGIFEILGNITRMFSSSSWGIYSLITRLDQLRASENIVLVNFGKLVPETQCARVLRQPLSSRAMISLTCAILQT